MQGEEYLRTIIARHNRAIKRLEERIAGIRVKKKKYQVILRDMRWERKQARKKAS